MTRRLFSYVRVGVCYYTCWGAGVPRGSEMRWASRACVCPRTVCGSALMQYYLFSELVSLSPRDVQGSLESPADMPPQRDAITTRN